MRSFMFGTVMILGAIGLTVVPADVKAAPPRPGTVIRPIIPFPTQQIPGYPWTNYLYRPLYGMRAGTAAVRPQTASVATYGRVSAWSAAAASNGTAGYGMTYYRPTAGYAANQGSLTASGGYYSQYVPAGYVVPK
jgi:hypothetical protein